MPFIQIHIRGGLDEEQETEGELAHITTLATPNNCQSHRFGTAVAIQHLRTVDCCWRSHRGVFHVVLERVNGESKDA